MATEPREWIGAVPFCERQPRNTTFASLPPEHQREIVRAVIAAAASMILVIAVAIVSRPIPSRSLGAYVRLPNPSGARATDAPIASIVPVAAPALRRAPHRSSPRFVRAAEIVAEDPSTVAPDAQPVPEVQELPRHRNVFSRFLRTVIRRAIP